MEALDNGSLVVEKVSEEYRITPAGVVAVDGQIREPLENLVLSTLIDSRLFPHCWHSL